MLVVLAGWAKAHSCCSRGVAACIAAASDLAERLIGTVLTDVLPRGVLLSNVLLRAVLLLD